MGRTDRIYPGFPWYHSGGENNQGIIDSKLRQWMIRNSEPIWRCFPHSWEISGWFLVRTWRHFCINRDCFSMIRGIRKVIPMITSLSHELLFSKVRINTRQHKFADIIDSNNVLSVTDSSSTKTRSPCWISLQIAQRCISFDSVFIILHNEVCTNCRLCHSDKPT
jgi:hypothetical protein